MWKGYLLMGFSLSMIFWILGLRIGIIKNPPPVQDLMILWLIGLSTSHFVLHRRVWDIGRDTKDIKEKLGIK